MNRSLFFIFLNENNNIINNDEWIYISQYQITIHMSKDTICKWAGINIKSHPHVSEQTPANGYV